MRTKKKRQKQWELPGELCCGYKQTSHCPPAFLLFAEKDPEPHRLSSTCKQKLEVAFSISPNIVYNAIEGLNWTCCNKFASLGAQRYLFALSLEDVWHSLTALQRGASDNGPPETRGCYCRLGRHRQIKCEKTGRDGGLNGFLVTKHSRKCDSAALRYSATHSKKRTGKSALMCVGVR